jgi:hypothetical protein
VCAACAVDDMNHGMVCIVRGMGVCATHSHTAHSLVFMHTPPTCPLIYTFTHLHSAPGLIILYGMVADLGACDVYKEEQVPCPGETLQFAFTKGARACVCM